jgi:hypothetical protein
MALSATLVEGMPAHKTPDPTRDIATSRKNGILQSSLNEGYGGMMHGRDSATISIDVQKTIP